MKDFGKILEQWEKYGSLDSRPPSSSKPRSTRPPSSGKANASPAEIQRRWLDDNPVVDKDEGSDIESPAERRRRLRQIRVQETIDLHLLTRDEAWRALEGFFRAARQRGLEKVLIIHGKGNHSEGGEAVLKEMCREFLEQCEYAGESGQADKTDGGSGATWVILRN
jgi:DNA-nicking Smr family endonuclease